MAIELNDGKITGSSNVAKAGLTLGIIGTALGLGVNSCWNGGRFGLFNNGYNGWNRGEVEQSEIAALGSRIAKLESMRYTDAVGIDLYREIISTSKEDDAKISALQNQLFGYVFDLDKRTALNAQAAELNRQFDNASRDYMFTILNNKIDCCCEKAAMQADFDRQTACMTSASILSYVNSTFVPGTLKLPITSICPQPTTSTTSPAA